MNTIQPLINSCGNNEQGKQGNDNSEIMEGI